MDVEMYMTKIMEKTGLTREELQKEIENEIKEMDDLIDDEGALILVAKRHGIDLEQAQSESNLENDIQISKIVPRTYVSIIGRIVSKESIRTFTRKSGGEGIVGSFFIKDNTGTARCVAWDHNAKILEDPDFKIGKIIRVVNGLVKENKFTGKLEVHIGNKSKIQLNPDGVDPSLIPSENEVNNEKITPISKLSLNDPFVNIEEKIHLIYPVTEFVSSKTGKKGLRGAIIVGNADENVRVTFWNEDTEKMGSLKEGQRIRITHLMPKKAFHDPSKIELTATNETKITIIEDVKEDSANNKSDSVKNDQFISIKELKGKSQGLYNIKGKIVDAEDVRVVTLRSGGEKSVRRIFIADSTDFIPVNLWGEDAKKELNIGDSVKILGIYTKKNNYSGELEANISRLGKIEKIEEDIDVKEEYREFKTNAAGITNNSSINNKQIESRTNISDIKKMGYFVFNGMVVKELTRITVYEACRKCGRKAENCRCPDGFSPSNRMILNLLVDDGTSPIRVTLFGENAEKMLGDSADFVKEIQMTDKYAQYLKKKSQQLIGKEFIFNGRSKFSDFTNNYEINVNSFKNLDYVSESERLIKSLEQD